MTDCIDLPGLSPRQAAYQRWNDHCAARAALIPSVYRSYKIPGMSWLLVCRLSSSSNPDLTQPLDQSSHR